MPKLPGSTTLTLPPEALVVFVDETGDEGFGDRHHPLFGLAGCAVLARRYEDLVAGPWKRLKKSAFGDEKAAIHASQMKNATTAQLDLLAAFFRTGRFMRLGVVLRKSSPLPLGLHPYHLVASGFIAGIRHFVEVTSPESVAVILEDSDRGNRLARKFLTSATLRGAEGVAPNVAWYHMRKSATEGLEVADFLANAVGGEVRARGVLGFRPNRRDFACTFTDVPDVLTYFRDIMAVEDRQTAGAPKV